MSLLTPLVAGIAAAIAIPSLLILYFLKLKRRDVEVSTTLLWKKAIEDLQANAPFQRLRNNILLILQLIALCAAIFALAQPEVKSNTLGGGRHVIVIDRSGSMSATDGGEDGKPGGKTRLEAAKKKALELVDSLKEPGLLDERGDEAMVVAFDVIADRLANFTSNKAELRRAIESVQPTDSPTSFIAAFQTARAFAKTTLSENRGLITTGAATIHLFSDGRLPDLEQLGQSKDLAITADDKIVYYPVGSPAAWNIGITGLRAERAFEDPGKLSIFVGITNSAREAKSVDVELRVDSKVEAIKTVPLPAARMTETTTGDAAAGVRASSKLITASSGVVFDLVRPQGGVFTIVLRTPEGDALAADNNGYLVVPPAKRLTVGLVTGGNLFLRDVLDGLNLQKLDAWSPAEAAGKFKDGATPTGYDVFVFDGWLPNVKGPDGKEAPGLPTGRFMVFNAIPAPPLGLVDEGPGEATTVINHDRGHPALRNISFDGLTVNPSRKCVIPPRAGVRPLAEGISGPLIAEATDVGTRALIVTFDTLSSNWPFDAGFVLFTAQGLTYLGSNAGDTGALVLRPGQTIEQTLPVGAANARVGLPDTTRKDLLVSAEGRVVFGPLTKVGVYTVSWEGQPGSTDVLADGRARRTVTANMLDPFESDVASVRAEEMQKIMPANVSAGQLQAGTRRLWPWFLLLALAFVLVEWYVYNRKVVI
ncbi:MAG: BatA and WFA domain-containing protein [Phycisphaerales bacterium]|nr:BatA and WFA domain-containing protein [Phycisphaerales bacterium]